MSWRVLARAENPAPGTLATLEELTGLGRGEVLLALRRNGLLVGDGFEEERARALSKTLGDLGLICSVSPDESPEATLFRVVLTGFKPGHRARLRETLQKLSGLPPEQIVVWLSRIPFVLRDSVDHETARRIKRTLVESGGMVDLRPVATPRPPSAGTVHGITPPRVVRETPPETPPAAVVEASEKRTRIPERTAEDPSPPLPESPPVLPEGRMPGQAPPSLLFRWPGSTPPEPPVLPSLEDLSRIPPQVSEAPPIIAPAPSQPENALSVYLSSVSPEAVDGVIGTLCERLDFRREEAMALIDGGMPSRVASGQPQRKAAEIAALLERPGVTVSLCTSTPSRPAPRRSPEGFMSWLNSSG